MDYNLVRSAKNCVQRILTTNENIVRCRLKINIRPIQTILKAAEHRSGNNFIIPPPEKWTGGSMHKVCLAYLQTLLCNNNYINCALLQIQLMPQL